jgi:hypothetical protein
MAMKNYRLEYEDGTFTHYQFDEADDVGKQQLADLRDAEKDKEHPLKKIVQADPEPFNVGSHQETKPAGAE